MILNKIFSLTNLLLFLITVVVLSLNAFPNLLAYLNTPKDMVFSGQASWFDPWDINVYVSSIKSGQTNGFLLPNLFTSIPNQPILMYPLYTATGIIFKSINPFLLFHIFAAFFGTVLILTLFILLKNFLTNFSEKIFALIGIVLGGGFGFFLYPLFQSPDSTMTSFTFQSAFQRPHEALGILFYILSLVYFYKISKDGSSNKNLFLESIFLFLAFLFYPYYLLSFILICAIFTFIKIKGEIKLSPYIPLFIILIPSVLLIFFIFNQFNLNNTFKDVLSQNLPTPNPLLLISGFGILFPLIIYQLFFLKKNQAIIFLNIWVFISLILAFLPFGFSRFYLRGLFFPIIILGIFSLKEISQKFHLNQKMILIIFIILIILTQFKTNYERILEVPKNNQWYYLSNSESKGLELLNQQSENKDAVLSLYKIGNIIPAKTHNSVYFGHLLQTPDATLKIQSLYTFYSLVFTEREAKDFLISNNISFIWFGKDEQEIFKTYSKKEISDFYPNLLSSVFKEDELVIYRVKGR